MAGFAVNEVEFDPYENSRFRVKWDGRYVAGVTRVSALRRVTEVVEHREGGNSSTSHKAPGRTHWEPITLERGLTRDREFENWANNVVAGGSIGGAQDFRKDILIDVFNEAGQKVLSYKVFKCWVSEYQALPDLDSSGEAIAIELIKLENEGWERDASIVAP